MVTETISKKPKKIFQFNFKVENNYYSIEYNDGKPNLGITSIGIYSQAETTFNNELQRLKDLDDAIEEFINFKGPYLLNVIVEKEENVFPMVPSGESVSNIRLE